jgi:hypothetical protein
MKPNFLLKIVSLGLFISIFVGCQTATSTSVKNGSLRKPGPTDLESKDYKIEGCIIPSPPEKTEYASKVEYMKSSDGKRIKVTETTYHPIDKFIFTPSNLMLEQYPYNLAQRTKSAQINFELMRLHEMKVKEKIFGYYFVGQEIVEKRNDNSNHGEMFSFTCFDLKGDGTFTYINREGKLSEIVPEWVTK